MRRVLNILIVLAAANFSAAAPWGARLILAAAFFAVNVFPCKRGVTSRISRLSAGAELLKLFLICLCADIVLFLLYPSVLHFAFAAATEVILFWNGMIRVYLSSVQLGIKHRILAALVWWVPIVDIWYLVKIIKIASEEAEFETEKSELDFVRANSEICKTKYPIFLVHGVFFRDFKHVNYWGRIPNALMKNGATVYYGEQQSALSVEESGRFLAERIEKIVRETGCGKVNIIAHSKGGLDSRAAISIWGADKYTASLTTISTPHRGCVFAEYLLRKVPQRKREKIAAAYNSAAKVMGDTSPDFLAAVNDLTESCCRRLNETLPDAPGVLYESVGSYCKRASCGKFPLNMTYMIAKYFDGKNDGLVSVKSAKWGERFTLLEPQGKRGISHGDVVDLTRENIKGFDVREFYVRMVSSLKERGF